MRLDKERIRKYFQKNCVIKCNNQEQWTEVENIINYRFAGNWYEGSNCINLYTKNTRCSEDHYRGVGFKILNADDFILPEIINNYNIW